MGFGAFSFGASVCLSGRGFPVGLYLATLPFLVPFAGVSARHARSGCRILFVTRTARRRRIHAYSLLLMCLANSRSIL